MQELTPEQLNRIGIQGGVAVAGVEGEAAQSGIRAGDVITRLNNLPVSDIASLDRIAAGLTAGRTYPILVIEIKLRLSWRSKFRDNHSSLETGYPYCLDRS